MLNQSYWHRTLVTNYLVAGLMTKRYAYHNDADDQSDLL